MIHHGPFCAWKSCCIFCYLESMFVFNLKGFALAQIEASEWER